MRHLTRIIPELSYCNKITMTGAEHSRWRPRQPPLKKKMKKNIHTQTHTHVRTHEKSPPCVAEIEP